MAIALRRMPGHAPARGEAVRACGPVQGVAPGQLHTPTSPPAWRRTRCRGRGDLALESCEPLDGLRDVLIDACREVRCPRDATRGGLASVLNEFAQAAGLCPPVGEQLPGIC